MKHVSSFNRNTRAVLIAAIASAYPLQSWAAPAARVEFSTGNVVATGSDGSTRKLAKGTEISAGDTINTANGRAQLRFTDGGLMSLSPDTEFKVEEYSFEGKQDGSEKSFFNLVKGGLRAITGAIGHTNKKNYKLNTPVATIGIRGTEFLATMHGRLLVRVGDGAIFVQNSKGDLVLYKGQSGEASEDEAPKRSDEQPIVTGPSPEIPFDYVAGNDTNQAGEPCLIIGGCAFESPSTVDGVTVSNAWIDDSEGVQAGFYTYSLQNLSTTNVTVEADSQGAFRVTETFDSGNGSTYTTAMAASADVARDSYGHLGGLSWSRWVGGNTEYTYYTNGIPDSTSTYQNFAQHFVWGEPTSTDDMTALADGNFVATYSVSGYTTPTLTNASTGLTTSVPGAVTGNMLVDFTYGDVTLNLNVGTAGSFSASDTGVINGSRIDTIYNGNFSANGFFSGANAAQAGVIYQNDDGSNILSGAAALHQTSLTAVPPN